MVAGRPTRTNESPARTGERTGFSGTLIGTFRGEPGGSGESSRLIRLHSPDSSGNKVTIEGALERCITRDRDPMHTPTLARIIVECAVLGAAVVPDRQRTNLPAESAGKLWLNGNPHPKIYNRPGRRPL